MDGKVVDFNTNACAYCAVEVQMEKPPNRALFHDWIDGKPGGLHTCDLRVVRARILAAGGTPELTIRAYVEGAFAMWTDDAAKKLCTTIAGPPRSVNRSEDAARERFRNLMTDIVNSDSPELEAKRWAEFDATIDSLLEDRERLDWIEKNGISVDRVPLGDTTFDVWWGGVRYQGKTARAAIDAARGVRPTPSDEGPRT